jgi:hypothetical protein
MIDAHFASKQGPIAARILATGGRFTIRGNTSRGIFLESQNDGIIFLSYETFGGPLTVTIPGELKGSLASVEPGSSDVHIMNGELVFESIQLRIAINQAEDWQPGEIPTLIPAQELQRSVLELAALAQAPEFENSLFQTTGAVLLQMPEGAKSIARAHIAELLVGLRRGDADMFYAAASQLAGLGQGLTPAGDDLLIGIILSAVRYSGMARGGRNWQQWVGKLPDLIRRRSTTLSYGIALAAVQGLADERIIAGLDALVAGREAAEVISLMRGYGASSGLDTLAGALLVFSLAD